MISSTVGEMLDRKLDIKALVSCQLYVVRDGDTIFYVGQSKSIESRFLEHLGISARGWPAYESQLGRLIRENAPESQHWQVELYSIKELEVDDVDFAEEALINILRPCLNARYNDDPSVLPDRYIDRDAREAAQKRAVLAAFGESEAE